MTRLSAMLFASLVSVASATLMPPIEAQSEAPVTITADPVRLTQNEEGTLRVHVVALANLERLEVVITADRGVALVRPFDRVTFNNVPRGETHDFEVPVRLTATEYGLVSVAATTTTAAGRRTRDQAILVGTMPPPPPRVPVGEDENLADLTLVQVSGGNAVVRFGQKSMVVVTKADRLGRNKAEIIEILAGRIVLDETFIGTDGKPNRARVTLKVGERGGTRVEFRPGETPPPASQVDTVVPTTR